MTKKEIEELSQQILLGVNMSETERSAITGAILTQGQRIMSANTAHNTVNYTDCIALLKKIQIQISVLLSSVTEQNNTIEECTQNLKTLRERGKSAEEDHKTTEGLAREVGKELESIKSVDGDLRDIEGKTVEAEIKELTEMRKRIRSIFRRQEEFDSAFLLA